MSTDAPSLPASVEERRARLAERLRQAAARSRSSPLSFGQERLWFFDQLEPNSPLYNMLSVVRLTGALNVAALEQALQAIAARHEVLRTRFVSTDGEPAQVIDPVARFQLQFEDLAGHDETRRESERQRRIKEETTRPFDLGAGHLLRATLLRLQPEEHVLILGMHHIVSDEWSFNIFFRELAVSYTGLVEGKPATLPELPIQYSDYAAWQRDWLKSEDYQSQLRFWTEQLSGNPAAVTLPTDRPRQGTPTFRGADRRRLLDKELGEQLKQLAHQEGVTPFMLLLAAFYTLLHRYTHQEDLIVGSPLAGRNRVETEDLIGFFVNTLPLRTHLSGDLSFRELLGRVREVALGAYSHQDLPFEKLVEVLHPERALNQTPFVSVMFLTQQGGTGGPQLPGLNLEFLGGGTGTAKFDLLFGVFETARGLVAQADYNTDLFDDTTISRLLEHYKTLLEGVVADPAKRLSELPLLGDDERRQLLVEWNATRTEYPRDRCVHELFEEQTRATPEAVAVTFGESCLTYEHLNARANQLAHYLRRCGVQPRMRVGICVERSLELIVGLLGILKAGAAYAPLEPGTPQERLALMLEDLQVPVLLTQRQLAGSFAEKALRNPAGPAPRLVCLDTDWKAIAGESIDDPDCEIGPEDLAYVSFTSGSTGRPKGVCVPHRGVVRVVRNTGYAAFSAAEVFLQMAPIAFDASTFEIWGALLNGARLVVLPPQVPTLSDLAEAIATHGVTTAWFTSGFFNQIVEEKPECLKSLRQVLTGGDVLSPPHMKKALAASSCRFINGYGPTENTTFTTCYPIPATFDGERPVPIGRPIANTECYVLDEHLQPVPIGVPGELYAGGDGLATGYLNRPELTAERFVPHPFRPGSRLYKTGDLVRYLADGNLEFLGRIDLQVKIRGFRVEPGEIESALLQHPGVRQCAVVARPDAAGTKQLVAYIVPREMPAPTTAELRQFLRPKLPDYMLPQFFVALAELPLSPNGKVDRRALPAPEARQEAEAEAAAPRDEVEARLQQLWEKVLNVRPIGIRDKFFALGGHSLLAVRLLALVEKQFGKKLKVAAIFNHPTIEQLAVLLRGTASPGADSTIVEIQPHGSRPPLLLVHGAGGGMFWGYSNLARHLGPDQPIFAFKPRGLEGREEFDTIEATAEAYLADLRSFQPHGPYYLGGYCFGGVVAYEMARRLQSQGETVAFLALINSTAPNSSYLRFRWTPVSACKVAKNVFLRTIYSFQAHPEHLWGFFRWKAGRLAKRLCGLFRSTPAAAPQGDSFDPNELVDLSTFPEDQRRLWQMHLRALVQYQTPTYPGRVTLFRSPVHLLYCSFDPLYGWGELAQGGVDLKLIPGAHETIMEEPGVQALAAAMQSCLGDW